MASIDHGRGEHAHFSPPGTCQAAALPDNMTEPDTGPLDAMSAAALVARVVHDIDGSNDEDCVVLLSDLLCAAWPSRWSQEQ